MVFGMCSRGVCPGVGKGVSLGLRKRAYSRVGKEFVLGLERRLVRGWETGFAIYLVSGWKRVCLGGGREFPFGGSSNIRRHAVEWEGGGGGRGGEGEIEKVVGG